MVDGRSMLVGHSGVDLFIIPVFKQSTLKWMEILQNSHFGVRESRYLNTGVITHSRKGVGRNAGQK